MTTDETHGIAAWFGTPLGQVLLQKETPLLIQGVRRCHGDSMLWLGPVPIPGVELDRCMVRNRMYGSMADEIWPLTPGSIASTYRGIVEELPFPPASLDAIVLHHALDCCSDPRAAMREVCKALRPGGRVLICSFNPLSLWGTRRIFARLRHDVFGQFRFVNPLRLLDWLAVLGIEIDEGLRYFLFRPPVAFGSFEGPPWSRVRGALERSRLPIGGVYYLLGRKSSAGVTPLRHAHSLRHASLTGAVVPGPTARLRQ